MPMATIHKVGQTGDLYHVQFLDPHAGTPGTDPGFGVGRPDRPGHDLPGSPGHPANRPPGSGGGAIPDNELPDHAPPTLAPGYTLVMVRSGTGKWEYAAIAPGSPPPRPLPPQGGGEHPGNRPPGTEHPGGGPMPTPPPRPDNTLPPAAQPR